MAYLQGCHQEEVEELNLPVYKFLEGPLVEKFGKEWYDELCEVAEQVLAELED